MGFGRELVAVGAGVAVFANFFSCPLARQSLLNAAFFAWFQIERMALDFLNDVFRLNLALEPAQRVFQRLAFL